jgi:hypothetical protein
MSYRTEDQLTGDVIFGGRVRSCATVESNTFKDDNQKDVQALAFDVLRGNAEVLLAFNRFVAAAPGLADQADNGDGTIDQAKVSDGDILAAVQAVYPSVAALYYDNTGTPISRGATNGP